MRALRFLGLSFILVLSALSSHANVNEQSTLTVYAYPAPVKIHWKSPKTIARSTVFSYLRAHKGNSHYIGHNTVEVNCKFEDGTTESFFTGMTSDDDGETFDLLFKKKAGLGVLFYNFKGRLQTRKEINKEHKILYNNGNLSFIKFKISDHTCQRLLRYEREYRERGYDQWYGLPNRPLYGEGSGCSAFAASQLSIAGLLDEEFIDGWFYSRRVPNKFLGKPIRDHKVNIFKLLFHRKSKWAKADEPHRLIEFWDPDTMHRWILKRWQLEKLNPSGKFRLLRRNSVLGLEVDANEVATPIGPIWVES